jgi:hypothetical protein
LLGCLLAWLSGRCMPCLVSTTPENNFLSNPTM